MAAMKRTLLVALLLAGCDDDTQAPYAPGTDAGYLDSSTVAPLDAPRVVVLDGPSDGDATAGDVLAPDVAQPDAPADAGTGADLALAAEGSYSAHWLATALDRVVIVKSDPKRNVCFSLTVTSPLASAMFAITAPESWSVQSAGAGGSAGACTPGGVPPLDDVAATSGTGTVRWTGRRPCGIDVEVTLTFPDRAWLPATEVLSASGLSVEGC
jgi:hypothetical protein